MIFQDLRPSAVLAGLSLVLIAGPGLGESIANPMAELPPQSQLGDGTVFFNQIPQFIRAYTYNPITFTFNPTYYFVISVPTTSLVPLQRVQLQQIGGTSLIQFLPQRNQAYVNEPRQAVQISQLPQAQAGVTQFQLEPPIQPGQTVTLLLRPMRNPTIPGIYQFGITVFPAGEKVRGNMTGTARLTFYNPGLMF